MAAWQETVETWAKSPLAFVTEALGAAPEPWQAGVLTDIEHGTRRIAIRAGHGVGKSALEAWLVLWFLLFRRPCKIPITANSQDQLRDVVWAEIAFWHAKLPGFLKELIDVTAERVTIKADPDNAFAVARTARPEKPEALQGFHSPNLFFVIEEASGIEDIIFETAGGALTGANAMVIMCGNPTRLQGHFFRAFHQNRASWSCYHVPCSASSRVDPSYAVQVASEYGEGSNVYRVRVLGEFPLSEDDAVIPLGLIESAINRDVAPTDAVGIVWGLDVARFGDDTTALAKRRGNVLIEPVREWRKLDNMQVAGLIAKDYRETPLEKRPTSINIDVIGLGAGVVDRLRELGLPARGINVGEASPSDPKRFMRFRDELWWSAREWFESRSVTMPKDDALAGELVSPKYKIESSGKIKIESKDDMKKRGIKSPNKADAFCLTFAGGDLVIEHREHIAQMTYDPLAVGSEDYQRRGGRQERADTDYSPF